MIISVENLKVWGNEMSIAWDDKEWTVKYPPSIDLQFVPQELLWVMFGMVTSEEWAWKSSIDVHLPEELKSTILDWWMGMLVINHKANPYGLNEYDEYGFTFTNGSHKPWEFPSPEGKIYPTIVMNGMGKDALCQIGMLTELSPNEKILAVTVDHPWEFSDKTTYTHLLNRLWELENNIGIPTALVQTNANEVFNMHIIPWYIYALPFMYLHQTNTCYHAMELEFNKYLNGVPIKPNTSVPVLLSINKLLKSLGYDMEYRSGTVPLSSYDAQKLLVERYPELQKLQTSCHHGFPNCNTCPKCQCHMAYLKVMGKNLKEYRYNGKIKKGFSVEKLLDIERESQHWALGRTSGQNVSDFDAMVSGYWKDALPYGIPHSESIIKEHFEPWIGSLQTYGKYAYNTEDWDKTAQEICNGTI